jgi:2-succinyl-5-enolpyruvyl-6-hydroxy-3-cyclohexene-1-carboxylate synthase
VSPATDTYVLLRAFVDELVRCGMRAACTSPGSRSAPLALTLAREQRLHCYSHIDERCSGFFALGLAKASGLPVAVTCTSGTAVAELLPVAVEAHEARVPLLLLTADRPSELRENGAGQAIDQLKLFGAAAKWFFEVGTHEATPERLRWMRTLACRAYATTLEGRPGVVHLNFPLREPLVTDEPLPDDDTGRADGAPYVRRWWETPFSEGDEQAELLLSAIGDGRCGVVVVGRDERILDREWSIGRAAAEFAENVGWPLLADPMSDGRRGSAAIAHYDAMLRDAAFAERHRPDVVLRVGDLPVSKPLRRWLAGLSQVTQISLDPEAAWQDPDSVVSHSLTIDTMTVLPSPTMKRLAADADWLEQWRSADELASEAILGTLRGSELSEPTVAAELGALLPAQATLFVASSMPVRDIETFWPVRAAPPRVLCNRGANGIDGIVSSAFGAAAADDGPVVLLIGDVALAHDIGGLLAAKRLDLKLTIVLLENRGGGIFEFLPLAENALAREQSAGTDGRDGEIAGDIYTRHIATPTGLDFADAARLYGLGHERVQDVSSFRAALERALASETSCIVEVPGERTENRDLHLRVWQAVSATLRR